MFPGLERAYVNHDYVQAITGAGAVPVLLPVIDDEPGIAEQIKLVDGILLTGGYDVNPLYYNEEPCAGLGFILPEVDKHQLAAAKLAAALGKPMLGICRGMQVLNVAFGGTLYQDILETPNSIRHVQNAQRHVAGHTVSIVADTVLDGIFGKAAIRTNSFHHQAVKELAPGFIVGARAADGVIEAMEKPGDLFTLAVQWHPEMMAGKSPDMRKLFQKFVTAAAIENKM
jgi:putative glutamine amidotransferase